MNPTLNALLASGAAAAPAIRAPGRPALSYAGLRDLTAATIARLNAIGMGRNDRGAIVLPNGPEMAAAFIAIGAGATTAPLNPAYRADEFNFYLTDLKAKALVVQKGVATEARDVAAKLGVTVLELVPGEHAGSFTWRAAALQKQRSPVRLRLAILLWCCTHQAPRRGPRLCLCLRRISAPRHGISARRWRFHLLMRV